PADLVAHSCIQYRFTTDGATVPWSFERNGRAKRITTAGGVTVNVPELAVRAAVDGLGIAYTLESLTAPFLHTGQLVRVLESHSPWLEALFLFYPERRQIPAALRAFIDMIRAPKSRQGRRSLKTAAFLPGGTQPRSDLGHCASDEAWDSGGPASAANPKFARSPRPARLRTS